MPGDASAVPRVDRENRPASAMCGDETRRARRIPYRWGRSARVNKGWRAMSTVGEKSKGGALAALLPS
jgi:hypothetical protein